MILVIIIIYYIGLWRPKERERRAADLEGLAITSKLLLSPGLYLEGDPSCSGRETKASTLKVTGPSFCRRVSPYPRMRKPN